MKNLIILNEAPYGSERSYNGLRLAHALAKNFPDSELNVFLMADAVNDAKRGQKVPSGYYSIELMLKSVLRHGKVFLCGTCMDARGLKEEELVDGAQRSDMDTLSRLTAESEKVLVF